MAQHRKNPPTYRLRNGRTAPAPFGGRPAHRHTAPHAAQPAAQPAAQHGEAPDAIGASAPQQAAVQKSALQRYGAMAWFGVILLALAIIPSLYSGLLTGANMDPTGNLDTVPAAVVNLDEPAESRGEAIHLGEDLTEELVHPDGDTDNLDWRPLGAAEARTALEAGDVMAVLTIPEHFSAHAAGLSTGEAEDAAQSTLRMQTNDGANIIMGTIARTIGETASSTVAEGIGEEYVKNVLLGFTEVHHGMQEAADGAGQVAEGSQDAESGAGDLVVGIDQLADGSVTLDHGAQQLAEGAAAANAGSQDLARGASSVDDGAQQLSTGLGQMRSQTESLPSQTQTLADGAGKVAAGVGQLDQGVTALEDTAGTLSGGAGQFASGLDEAVAGALQLRDSASAVVTGVQQVQGDAGTLQERIANLRAAGDSMTDEQRQAALAELADGAAQVTAGAEQAAAGASTVNEGRRDRRGLLLRHGADRPARPRGQDRLRSLHGRRHGLRGGGQDPHALGRRRTGGRGRADVGGQLRHADGRDLHGGHRRADPGRWHLAAQRRRRPAGRADAGTGLRGAGAGRGQFRAVLRTGHRR
ncbi:YhgE/Pip family protein [Citricoccus sp. I39-566]|nr:YhgE/Pip family protein [Citricoccus sp. I39-566]WMY79136.1 YhgE/Pip family protein [Citricoccus sp. I39-566]